jgi:lipid-A-disaccharide synthase
MTQKLSHFSSRSIVDSFDLIVLANGPGEVTTWVRPVVRALRQQLGVNRERVRISVILSPCPHSTGTEAEIAASYPEVDRVLAAEAFFSFLLWGKTPENWDWRSQGSVIFLGGDQFYTLAVAKRLGYQSLIYAEWEARWYRWIDRFAAMNQTVVDKIPAACRHKFTIVGDLMADVVSEVDPEANNLETSKQIGLLVGSKPAKLSQGVPLCLAIAEILQQQRCNLQFMIFVAPTLNLDSIAYYADPQHNPLIDRTWQVSGKIVTPTMAETKPYLITSGGTKIQLITQFPAYQELTQCQICLTTVGANTAELGSLGIPAIVLLPTQQLDAMRSWNGIPGILANLPGIGTIFAKTINWYILRQKRLFAWPNIWAKAEIMPELVGNLQAKEVADLVLEYLDRPEKLQTMRDRLNAVRGVSGAAQKIAAMVRDNVVSSRNIL